MTTAQFPNRQGCLMNTDEGGLSAWHMAGGADLVFQIVIAEYGVCDAWEDSIPAGCWRD